MDTRFSKRFKVDVWKSKSGTYIDIVDAHNDRHIYATVNIGYFRGGRHAPVNIDVRYDPDYFVGVLQEERGWATWRPRPAWAPTPKPPAPSPDTRPKVQFIIDIVRVSSEKWWVNCVETGLSSGAGKETCAIYLNPQGESVDVGDNIWWQGSHAYWTPDDRSRTDVKLPRIGFSGVPHPHRDRVAS